MQEGGLAHQLEAGRPPPHGGLSSPTSEAQDRLGHCQAPWSPAQTERILPQATSGSMKGSERNESAEGKDTKVATSSGCSKSTAKRQGTKHAPENGASLEERNLDDSDRSLSKEREDMRQPVGARADDVSKSPEDDKSEELSEVEAEELHYNRRRWRRRAWRKAKKRVRHCWPLIGQGLKELVSKLVDPAKALLPSDGLVRCWDMLMVLLLIYTATFTPYYVAFVPLRLNFLFWMDRVVDLLFLLDIALTFNIAYEISPRVYVTNKKKVAGHYLRNWFAVDLIGSFPYTIVAYAIRGAPIRTQLVIKVVRLLRLLLLLRFYRARRVMKQLQRMWKLEYQHLKLLEWLFVYLISNHWLGCGWRLIPDLEEHYEGGWIESAGLGGQGNWSLYFASIYWAAMTTTTIGYGDISPATMWERFYAIFAMLIGAGLYAYVIGNLCGILSSFRSDANRLFEMMDHLKALCEKYEVPKHLQSRLRRYFRYHWWHRGFEQFKEVLDFMSPSLRQQVLMHAHAGYLTKVPSFAHCPRAFLAQLSPYLKKEVYGPHESFTERDEEGHEKIYIILKGLVATSKGALLTSGQVVGEECLWLGSHSGRLAGHENAGQADKLPSGEQTDPKRGFTVMTLTHTVVQSIHREDVLDVLERFPEARKAIDRARVRRLAWEGIRAFTQALTAVQNDVDKGLVERTLDFRGHNRQLQSTYEEVLAGVVEAKLKDGEGVEGLGRETLEAAVKIQRAFRRSTARKNVKVQMHAVVRLQALFRGRQARREYRKLVRKEFAKALTKRSPLTGVDLMVGMQALLDEFQEANATVHAKLAVLSHLVNKGFKDMRLEMDVIREEAITRDRHKKTSYA